MDSAKAKKSTPPPKFTSLRRGRLAGAKRRSEAFIQTTVRSATAPAMVESSKTFGEHLDHQAALARAQGEAHGDFALASGRTREKQIGKIDAGDEQHEGDGAEEHEQFGAHVADEIFLDGDEARSPAGGLRIVDRIFGAQLRGESFEFGLGCGDGEAGLQARDGAGKHAEAAYGRMRKRIGFVAGGDPGVDIGFEWCGRDGGNPAA